MLARYTAAVLVGAATVTPSCRTRSLSPDAQRTLSTCNRTLLWTEVRGACKRGVMTGTEDETVGYIGNDWRVEKKITRG